MAAAQRPAGAALRAGGELACIWPGGRESGAAGAALTPRFPCCPQVVSLLLSWWAIVGCLLPTLLLLLPGDGRVQAGTRGAGGEPRAPTSDAASPAPRRAALAAAAATWVQAADVLEARLRGLLPAPPCQGAGEEADLPPSPRAVLLARWLLVLLCTWLIACFLAPLYPPPTA